MNRKNRILGSSTSSARAMWAYALIAGGVLLVGCGQKGPLILPSGAGTAPVTAPYPIESSPLPEEIVIPR